MNPEQQRRVGIQNEILDEIVCGYADIKNTAISMQQQMQEGASAREQQMQEIVRKGAEHVAALEQENATLADRIAKLEAHRCPVLGEMGEGDATEDVCPRTMTLIPSAAAG